ncbi:MAG TPA: RNA polymerase factor sigma-54 [Alphaproteobacteria bacterium]|nr:RNA polymerase sigma-54 factor [Rhodospirillaceae bacterium]HRJ12519.1 RNA polymerase factor sigma-54 [Alphaproteobacteria bacterium]
MNTPSIRLEMRAQQQLVMTPALQQAISLLQLNNLELAALLNEEAEQNPLLEVRSPDDGAPGTTASISEAAQPAALGAEGLTMSAGDDGGAQASDYESGINEWSDADSSGNFDGLANDDPFRNTEERETLRDHLMTQIQMDFEGAARAAAALLCDYLDEAGYLRADLVEIAAQLEMPLEDLLHIVGRLQNLDPPGIFARNLAECLELQLSDRNALSPEMAKLLANLELLGVHDFEKLQKKCGVDRVGLDALIAQIRACDPKPAAAFDHAPPASLIPDILLRAVRDAESGLPDWELELNAETLPRALVKEKYFTRVMESARDDKSKKFLEERRAAAHWLVRALQSRAETILKVSRAIVKFQDAFFHKGITELKPLTLKDIAAEVAMHESTISRVTSGKYMATPRGTYELKYFFNASLSSAHGGADVASESVRQRIKQLIASETNDDILSDDRLVLTLQSEGVDIARRTVAKYREALGIPGSFHRKRMAKTR